MSLQRLAASPASIDGAVRQAAGTSQSREPPPAASGGVVSVESFYQDIQRSFQRCIDASGKRFR